MPASRKTLTVTYYVDPRDLKVITISIRSACTILALCAVLLVSGLSSLVYFAASIWSNEVVTVSPPGEAAQVATADVFTSIPKAASDSSAANQEEQAATLELDADIKLPKVATPQAEALTSSKKPPSLAKPKKTPEQPATVAITNTAFKQDKAQVIFSFAVENKSSDQISGRVWAFANFKDGGNKPLLIASHPELSSKDPASTANAAHGVSYKAKIRSFKELRFQLPSDWKGEFSGVTVYVQEAAMQTPARFELSAH